ncbi:hypothetical protein ABCR94_33975 [Streptomyces sp. 21So2-11]|uniref:hypothetical protein n=1 Tax=Streptomyces sp. 21So2-11 TaxID=3144408 RepID=UPI00321AC347
MTGTLYGVEVPRIRRGDSGGHEPDELDDGVLDYLAPGEVLETVDRLAARGFVEWVGDRGVRVNSLAACVIERRELPARFLMQWNADKASSEGAPMPGPPVAVPATSQS